MDQNCYSYFSKASSDNELIDHEKCSDNIAADRMGDALCLRTNCHELTLHPWIKAEELGVVDVLEETVNEILSCPRSTATVNQYVRLFQNMEAVGAFPEEVSSCKKTFYVKRAAYKFGMAECGLKLVKQAAAAIVAGEERKWRRTVRKIKNTLLLIEEHPNPEKIVPGTSLFQNNSLVKKHHESKRKNAKYLPTDWRERICSAFSDASANKPAAIMIALTGARVSELAKSVTIILRGHYLLFGIKGSKQHGGKYGQELREITVCVDTP